MSVRNAMALESVSGFKGQKFVPADQSEWKEMAINISSFIASKPNVRFKFEFVSGLGNNIYIDDVNITSTTGISEEDQNNSLLVYPNPVSEVLTIDFAETNINSGSVEIKDLSGRTVYIQSIEERSKNGSPFTNRCFKSDFWYLFPECQRGEWKYTGKENRSLLVKASKFQFGHPLL